MGRKGKEVKIDIRDLIERKNVFRKNPQLLWEEREEWIDRLGSKLTNLAGKNLSHAYTHILQGVVGGRVLPMYENSLETNIGRADIAQRRYLRRNGKRKYAERWVESKISSTRNNQWLCSTLQFARFCEHLLKDLDLISRYGRDVSKTGVSYAFSRYSRRKDEPLSELTNRQLVEKACRDLKDILIVPVNVAMVMFEACRRDRKDQRSSQSDIDYVDYWRVRGKHLNMFARGLPGLDDLFRERNTYLLNQGQNYRFFRRISADDLGLDDLTFGQTEINGIGVGVYDGKERVTGYEVRPFIVSEFRNSKEGWERFVDTFRKKHGEILVDIFGLTDFYVDSTDESDIGESAPSDVEVDAGGALPF